MTFVGKILVIVIMVFALFFLAMSVVVFSTARNWKDEAATLKKNIGDLQKKVNDANAERDQQKLAFDAAKADFTKQVQILETDINTQKGDIDRKQQELTQLRTDVAVAMENAKSSLTEVESKRQELDRLRSDLGNVQKEASEYKIQQVELQNDIRVLQRQLETAKQNNADLRSRVQVYASALRQNGLSDNVAQYKGTTAPPDIEGEVKRVGARNDRVEITIGSDDGVVVGQQYELFRTNPRPEYLGRIRIIAVEPDQAVGEVIGKTYLGKKIEEGDHVAASIRTRG